MVVARGTCTALGRSSGAEADSSSAPSRASRTADPPCREIVDHDEAMKDAELAAASSTWERRSRARPGTGDPAARAARTRLQAPRRRHRMLKAGSNGREQAASKLCATTSADANTEAGPDAEAVATSLAASVKRRWRHIGGAVRRPWRAENAHHLARNGPVVSRVAGDVRAATKARSVPGIGRTQVRATSV